MVERICPTCQHGNPIDDRYCGKCGAALERLLPVRASASPLTVMGRNLPVNWQQLGTSVAIGAAAVAAEIGLAWLRRRIEGGAIPSSPGTALAPRLASQVKRPLPVGQSGASIVTIISQRIIEVAQRSDGTHQITERHWWQKIEE